MKKVYKRKNKSFEMPRITADDVHDAYHDWDEVNETKDRFVYIAEKLNKKIRGEK